MNKPPGTMRLLSGYPAAASHDGNAVHGRSMKPAGFSTSARRGGDVLYPAYVLVLVLGLRKGELLGLTWELQRLNGWGL